MHFDNVSLEGNAYLSSCLIFQEENCYSDCPPRYEPVCGSDGNTYNSVCELNDIAGCRNTPELTKFKDRPCDVGECYARLLAILRLHCSVVYKL